MWLPVVGVGCLEFRLWSKGLGCTVCVSPLLGGIGCTCVLPSVGGFWLYLRVDFGLMCGFGIYFLWCWGGGLYGVWILIFEKSASLFCALGCVLARVSVCECCAIEFVMNWYACQKLRL